MEAVRVVIDAFRQYVPSAALVFKHATERAEDTVVVYDPDDNDAVLAKYTIRKVNRVLGFSCKLEITPWLRSKGLYRPLHRLKIEHARELGYGTLIATVRTDNEAEMRAALKNGWSVVVAGMPGADVPWVNMLATSTGLAVQPQED